MKILKAVFKKIIYSIITLVIIFTFLLSLFLIMNIKVSIVFSIITILLSFALFCFCIYALFSEKKPYQFLFLKGINGLFSLTGITISLTLGTIFFFSINLMISTELGNNLTLEEKFNLYMLPFQEKKNSVDYKAMKMNKLSTTYQNVSIYYEPNEKELIPIIEQVIDKADSITTSLFGPVQDNNIDLILHASADELYERTSLIETMGYFDDPNDTVGIAISDIDQILTNSMPGTFYFQSTIMHEYTHYRLQAFIKEKGLFVYRIPLWFHEGVAEFVGMNNVAHRYYPFKETTFENLSTHEDWEKFRLNEYDVYLQSYYAIQYLVDNYGETMIRKIIEETAKENDFNEGFTNATGVTIDELEGIYLEKLKQNVQ